MHQAGGSGARNDSLRCAGLRQRGTMALARVTSSWVLATTFHSRAVLSPDAVTIRLPSGLNAALVTLASCPLNSAMGRPVSAFHSRAVRSPEVVTMSLPSGLDAALDT